MPCTESARSPSLPCSASGRVGRARRRRSGGTRAGDGGALGAQRGARARRRGCACRRRPDLRSTTSRPMRAILPVGAAPDLSGPVFGPRLLQPGTERSVPGWRRETNQLPPNQLKTGWVTLPSVLPRPPSRPPLEPPPVEPVVGWPAEPLAVVVGRAAARRGRWSSACWARVLDVDDEPVEVDVELLELVVAGFVVGSTVVLAAPTGPARLCGRRPVRGAALAWSWCWSSGRGGACSPAGVHLRRVADPMVPVDATRDRAVEAGCPPARCRRHWRPTRACRPASRPRGAGPDRRRPRRTRGPHRRRRRRARPPGLGVM